tara:strand:- start:1714 stop:2829 length:1116 start_codon:yes stop_codon:yes gene_type:complete
MKFIVGNKYTRDNIYNLLNLNEPQRGGDWLNGYHRHENTYFIFASIGIPGRTGHNYQNHWDGEKLVWFGKNQSHFDQKTIKNLLSKDFDKLIFYRLEDRAPFVFAGYGIPQPHRQTQKPVRIDWQFENKLTSWSMISNSTAIKSIDRSSILHFGSAIPKDKRWFFQITGLKPGDSRDALISFRGEPYEAKLINKIDDRTQILWKADLQVDLQKVLPGYFRHYQFKENLPINSAHLEFTRLSSTNYALEVIKEDLTLPSEKEIFLELEEELKRSKSNPKERKKRLLMAKVIPDKIEVVSTQFRRNPDVIAEVLERAAGICEKCKTTAPFTRASDGTPYLEVHHIIPLSQGGPDTTENALGLCPNCHREAHFG